MVVLYNMCVAGVRLVEFGTYEGLWNNAVNIGRLTAISLSIILLNFLDILELMGKEGVLKLP